MACPAPITPFWWPLRRAGFSRQVIWSTITPRWAVLARHHGREPSPVPPYPTTSIRRSCVARPCLALGMCFKAAWWPRASLCALSQQHMLAPDSLVRMDLLQLCEGASCGMSLMPLAAAQGLFGGCCLAAWGMPSSSAPTPSSSSWRGSGQRLGLEWWWVVALLGDGGGGFIGGGGPPGGPVWADR